MDYLKRIICFSNKYEHIIKNMIIKERNINLIIDQTYYFTDKVNPQDMCF